MKVEVNKEACIGCGACAAICPDVFEIDDEGLSTVKVETVSEELQEDTTEAVESCPTAAITTEQSDTYTLVLLFLLL